MDCTDTRTALRMTSLSTSKATTKALRQDLRQPPPPPLLRLRLPPRPPPLLRLRLPPRPLQLPSRIPHLLLRPAAATTRAATATMETCSPEPTPVPPTLTPRPPRPIPWQRAPRTRIGESAISQFPNAYLDNPVTDYAVLFVIQFQALCQQEAQARPHQGRQEGAQEASWWWSFEPLLVKTPPLCGAGSRR